MSVLNHFPTGGGINETLNATPEDVMKGFKFVGLLQDDIEVGTLELTGNALVNHVTKGKTFYTTNPKEIIIGIMEVNDISNFSLNLISGRNITAKWTNPQIQTGRPYSGVYIKYQTGSYPTPTTGTQAYKGVGSTSSAGAVSQVNLSLPALDTTYYFIIYSYCTTSNGEMLGTQLKATINTGSSSIIRITSSQSYTVPAGYNLIDVFCVGGGGGNMTSSRYYGGGGAGGGYTKTVSNINISSGQVLNCTVGGGGVSYNNGGASSVSSNGTVLCTANGGNLSKAGLAGTGGSGGGSYASNSSMNGGSGGSNGGNGGGIFGNSGQGTTTRAFGESSGTLYAGGGGGGAYYSAYTNGGNGGAGGGGRGGNRSNRPGGNGGTNTGGGAGGGFQSNTSSTSENPDNHSQGGSGIILIRLK